MQQSVLSSDHSPGCRRCISRGLFSAEGCGLAKNRVEAFKIGPETVQKKICEIQILLAPCKLLIVSTLKKNNILTLKKQKTMEKEIKYIAPEAEVLSAQVEKGFAGSGDGSFEQPGFGEI